MDCCYGCGDAVIGINPASDNMPVTIDLLKLIDELIQRYGIPTQSCVLAHVTNQLAAIERGAPVDLVFQSIAGTEADKPELWHRSRAVGGSATKLPAACSRGTVGHNVMYFETGQGSCLSAGASSRRRSANARSPGLRRGARV